MTPSVNSQPSTSFTLPLIRRFLNHLPFFGTTRVTERSSSTSPVPPPKNADLYRTDTRFRTTGSTTDPRQWETTDSTTDLQQGETADNTTDPRQGGAPGNAAGSHQQEEITNNTLSMQLKRASSSTHSNTDTNITETNATEAPIKLTHYLRAMKSASDDYQQKVKDWAQVGKDLGKWWINIPLILILTGATIGALSIPVTILSSMAASVFGIPILLGVVAKLLSGITFIVFLHLVARYRPGDKFGQWMGTSLAKCSIYQKTKDDLTFEQISKAHPEACQEVMRINLLATVRKGAVYEEEAVYEEDPLYKILKLNIEEKKKHSQTDIEHAYEARLKILEPLSPRKEDHEDIKRAHWALKDAQEILIFLNKAMRQ